MTTATPPNIKDLATTQADRRFDGLTLADLLRGAKAAQQQRIAQAQRTPASQARARNGWD